MARRKSEEKPVCIAFAYQGTRYLLHNGTAEELPDEVRQAAARKFYETDAQFERRRIENLRCDRR